MYESIEVDVAGDSNALTEDLKVDGGVAEGHVGIYLDEGFTVSNKVKAFDCKSDKYSDGTSIQVIGLSEE